MVRAINPCNGDCEMRDCSKMEKLLQIQRGTTSRKGGEGDRPEGSPSRVPIFLSEPHLGDSALPFVLHATSELCLEVSDPPFSLHLQHGNSFLLKK